MEKRLIDKFFNFKIPSERRESKDVLLPPISSKRADNQNNNENLVNMKTPLKFVTPRSMKSKSEIPASFIKEYQRENTNSPRSNLNKNFIPINPRIFTEQDPPVYNQFLSEFQRFLKSKDSVDTTEDELVSQNNQMKSSKLGSNTSRRFKIKKDILSSDPLKYCKEVGKELEEFQKGFHKNIKLIQRAQDHTSHNSLVEEIAELKRSHELNILETEKRKNAGYSMMINSLRQIKEDISEKLKNDKEEASKNFQKINENFDLMKGDIRQKMEFMENKQKVQTESLKYLVDSKTNRLKDRTSHLIDLKAIKTLKKDLEEAKLRLIAENKDFEKKRRKSSMNDHLIEDIISNKRKLNQELTEGEAYEGELENKLLLTKNLFEKLKIERLLNARESQKYVKNLGKKRIIILKGKSRFRSYVYVILMKFKLLNLRRQNLEDIKKESLFYFIHNYTTFKRGIINLLDKSTSKMIENIENLYDLDITLIDREMKYLKQKEIEERIVKIEGLITVFFENLTSETHEKSIDSKTINILQVISTENSCVPLNFYCMFEKSRLKFNENFCLSELRDEIQKLIFGILIIIKLLLKEFLIPLFLNEENQTKQKNLKMISSVIYIMVLDYFIENSDPPDNNENAYLKFYNVKKIPISNKPDKNKFDDFNNIYFDRLYEHIHRRNYEMENDETNKILFNQNLMLKITESDSDVNDFSFIGNKIYRKNDLNSFVSLIKKRNFDFELLLSDWLEKIYSIVYN